MQKERFTLLLKEWSRKIERDLPWKADKDPYKIWLSEIILQQTRVAQGRPYYLKFIKHFPSIIDLANASQEEIFSLWEGLGYYSRARNLHSTAKIIASQYKGVFPNDYNEIIQLKGIGPYTAAAISSFAFDQAHAVVDGNVQRVLTRVFGIHEAIDSSASKKKINKLADHLLDTTNPSAYNQAIMDFGALQCKPKSPNCPTCPLSMDCIALKAKLVDELPKKSKKVKKRSRYFHYLKITDSNNQQIIQKRLDKDIWQDLFQFPLIETANQQPLDIDHIQRFTKDQFEILPKLVAISKPYKQTLSHQYIHAWFYELKEEKPVSIDKASFYLADPQNVSNFAFPKIIRTYLEDKALTLFKF